MKRFKEVFKVNKPVIAMIHLDALTGTPKYKNNNNKIIEKALKEAEIYIKAGVDSISIENMHDIPYIKNHVGHEISSIMSIIAYQIKKMSNLPCGIQILAGANKEALAVAKSSNLDFIRAEGFVFSHVADEGIIESCAGDLLRYRKQIEADNILVFTDIKKKHSSHAITSDVDIVETAHAAEFFLSDGVIITGVSTGSEASINEIEQVKNNINIPVLVGSGVTIDNLDSYLKISDSIIVGSYFKKEGNWVNGVDYDRTSKFMEKVNKLR
ncbi:MAG: BtpA/SgcQ family protein [Candidatus Sericytochromatia bacterium]